MTRHRTALPLVALLIAAALLAACTGPGASSTGGATLAGTALAGPVCPVEQDPPDPACADRPVPGAVVVVRSADGREVGRTTTDATGRFSLSLDPGDYRLEPQPVEGLLGTAPALDVTLGPSGVSDLVLAYDTGIR